MLNSFARWFSSARGVWQTLSVCCVLVAIEFLFPHLDQHGFWLLYWMTIYSGVTQNILAYVNRQDTTHSEEVLDEILDDVEELKEHPSKESD